MTRPSFSLSSLGSAPAALLAAAFFAAFFVYPVGYVLAAGLTDADGKFSTAAVASVFTDPVAREGLLNAALIASAVTVLSCLIGVPLAWLADRYDFPLKNLFTAGLLVPMILPPFVGAVGLRHLFARSGGPVNQLLAAVGILKTPEYDWFGENRFVGVVLLEALHLYPIIYLNTAAALANIDPSLEQAARNMGASGWTLFRRITLPLMRPGLFAGATLVFIWSFTELGTPLMFDYRRVTPVQIFDGLNQISDSRKPFALALVLLLAAGGLYALGRAVFGGRNFASVPKASAALGARALSPLARLAIPALFLLVTAAALVPHVGVILTSVAGRWYGTMLPDPFTAEHYRIALEHPLTVPSVANSIKFSGVATLIDLALGLAVAWVAVRSGLPGGRTLDTLSMMPLAVPGLVTAFGYLAAFRGTGLDPRVDPTALLVIAYAVRRLPYVVRSAVSGLEQTPPALEEAAANLGAPPATVLRRVTVPLIAANLIAGGLLAFSFAMLEVSDSLVLAARQPDYPITKAIYELSNRLGDGPYIAAALGVWAMLLLTLTLVTVSQLLGKRMGAIFRG
jgi:iron(III) transport system permease protein